MIKEQDVRELRERIRPYMTSSRYPHVLGVEDEMRALAAYFLPDKIVEGAVAGLLHDITRRLSHEEQLAYIQKHGIELSEEELSIPPALHAKTGAHFIRTQFPELADDIVIRAIEKHTLADEDMTVFDMLLFLADFIEINRPYEDCKALRREFYDRMDERSDDKEAFLYELMIKACDASIKDLLETSRPIAVKTILARNNVLTALAASGKK